MLGAFGDTSWWGLGADVVVRGSHTTKEDNLFSKSWTGFFGYFNNLVAPAVVVCKQPSCSLVSHPSPEVPAEHTTVTGK
eukprot:3592401-Amphidinium_carterae.1